MIRTTFSFLALCAGLFGASRLIHESIAAEKSTSAKHPGIRAQVILISPTRPTDAAPAEQSPAAVSLPAQGTAAASQADTALRLKGPADLGASARSTQDSAPAESLEITPPANTSGAVAGEPAAVPGTTDAATSAEPASAPSAAVAPSTDPPAELTDDHMLDTVPVQKAPGNLPLDLTQSPAGSQSAAPADRPATVGESTAKPLQAEPALKPVAAEPPPLTPELVRLREDVRDCLSYYYNKYDNVVEHSPWGIMHVLIAYGVDTQVIANGRTVNAIGWLCWNGTCRGQRLFEVNQGRIQTHLGPGVQGHDGQFLAMMAQSRVSASYPMRIDGRDFTLADLIEHEQRTCHAGTELTFKLIGLAHYLESEAEWRNEDGEPWSISRLIKEELAQNVIGAACGGTHRMMGFTYAVQKREKEGKPLNGQWKRARTFLNDYFDYTFYLQNGDGSFSTDFFRGRNDYGDIDRRIETTGHILEWFVASLPSDKLRDPRVIKSVTYLTRLMLDNRHHEWEIGPRGHALHALAIYAERVFADRPGQRDAVLARQRSNAQGYQQR